MLLKLIFTTLCIALLSFGCGASTPEPESADSEGGGTASLEGTGETGDEDASGSSTDPETTEEVIETSTPLD